MTEAQPAQAPANSEMPLFYKNPQPLEPARHSKAGLSPKNDFGFSRSTNAVVGVPLQPDGDFRIDDVLVPAPPADCASPVLLIRTVAPPTNPWFAAGIPKQD